MMTCRIGIGPPGFTRIAVGRSAMHHRRMARIVFTQQLRRFTDAPELQAPAATLRSALEAAFAANPRHSFLGEPVSMVLPPTTGDAGGANPSRLYAALNLGHFGVKLHGSDDGGETWQELATPTYPPQPDGEPVAGVAWKLVQIWS